MRRLIRQGMVSRTAEEGPITARVEERPSIKLAELRQVRFRDLGLRFLAGGVTSVVAGLISYGISARVGGFLLAFPAILGASLTLVEEQEDSAEAREDSRGATVGACSMAAFAAVAALTLTHVTSVLALALATAAWAIGALGGTSSSGSDEPHPAGVSRNRGLPRRVTITSWPEATTSIQ